MSGHSKWSTIKHKKALTDAKRGKLFSKISRMLMVAVREKGPKQETNLALRLALEKAREANMPGDNIDRIIKKYSVGGGEKLESVQFEAYGPSGSAFIVDAITDSRNRTSQEIKHALSKHGGALAAPGSVLWLFDKFGKITVAQSGSRDALELSAIEAGAHDIGEENGKFIVFTKPEELHKVAEGLKERGVIVENAILDYIPKMTVALKDDAAKNGVEALFEALDDNDDVQEIYSNVSFDA